MKPRHFYKLAAWPLLAVLAMIGVMVLGDLSLASATLGFAAVFALAIHLMALHRLAVGEVQPKAQEPQQPSDRQQTALAFAVSHEVRQPLFAIQLAADNAYRKLALGGEQGSPEPEIERILRQCDRALEIVKQTCALAQSVAGPAGVTHLATAVEEAVSSYSELAAAELVEITVSASHAARAARLPISQTAFEQVLTNAFSNAVDSIKRKRGAGSHEKGQIAIMLDSAAGIATCKITDNGQGLAAADSGRVFEPFYSSKQDGAGGGFGLYISREIIARANGHMTLCNSAEGGARLTITLPAHEDAPGIGAG